MNSALILVDTTDEYLKPWGTLYIGRKEAERVIAHIKEQLIMARRSNIQVIYVVTKTTGKAEKNGIITDLPPQDDLFITKPSMSAFIDTPLETILRKIDVKNIIVAGVGTDTSILFTLYDAKMRGFEATVIENCLAAFERIYHTFALKIIRDALKVDII